MKSRPVLNVWTEYSPISKDKNDRIVWITSTCRPWFPLFWTDKIPRVFQYFIAFLPPANEVCEGYVFTGVCLSTPGGGGVHGFIQGGMHGFIQGGIHGFIQGGMRGFIQGGIHGFIQGGMRGFIGGCAWFYSGGGVHGFIWGACVVLFGGACMVLFGGCAWFYWGGMHGFIRGACMVLFRGWGMRGFFSFFGYNEIRSMSRRYASYWNAFLFQYFLKCFVVFNWKFDPF